MQNFREIQNFRPRPHPQETIWVVRATSRGIYVLTTAPLEYKNIKSTQNGLFIFCISSFDSTKPPLSPGKWMTCVLTFVNGSVRLRYRGSGLLWGPGQMFATGVQCMVPYYHALDFHASLQPPPLLCLGDRKPLQEEWGLVPDVLRVLFVEAESKLVELKYRGARAGGRTRRPAARAMACAPPAPRVGPPREHPRGFDVGSRGGRR